MVWTWQFEKADGSTVAAPNGTEEFPTQGDAESWIGESWKELLDGGVDQVVLLEDGDKVYGPMNLHPDDEGAEPAAAAPADQEQAAAE
jgi:uncharacterized protein (DUF2237 family)